MKLTYQNVFYYTHIILLATIISAGCVPQYAYTLSTGNAQQVSKKTLEYDVRGFPVKLEVCAYGVFPSSFWDVCIFMKIINNTQSTVRYDWRVTKVYCGEEWVARANRVMVNNALIKEPIVLPPNKHLTVSMAFRSPYPQHGFEICDSLELDAGFLQTLDDTSTFSIPPIYIFPKK